MNAVLDIDRWSTRIRRAEPALAQTLVGGMRRLVDRLLSEALAAATRRALSRAGLPVDAAVAVRRLDLVLRLAGAIEPRRLAEIWAATFAEALATRLAGVPAGEAPGEAYEGGEGDQLVWFPDHWAAEYRHLQRCADGEDTAWWALELAAGGGSAAQLSVDAVVRRWLAADAARALASLAALAATAPAIARALDSRQAAALTEAIVRRLATTTRHGSAADAAEPFDTARPDQRADHRFLAAALVGIEPLRRALATVLTAEERPTRAAPWLLAALLTQAPAVSRLPATAIEAALTALWRGDRESSAGRSTRSPRPVDRHDDAGRPPSSLPRQPPDLPGPLAKTSSGVALAANDAVSAIAGDDADRLVAQPVLLGGLLLLIRPLSAGGRLPAAEELPTALADLALLALRRVLSTLPRGEREVAEERERPLLTVFAPQGDWRERIARQPIHRPAAAEQLLEALLAQVPIELAAVPGAERRLFGQRAARFASEADRRLARLLLRPGELRLSRWQAEMFWPLQAVDPLLRRAGWDQDPGWLPWLGRRIVFHFGVTP